MIGLLDYDYLQSNKTSVLIPNIEIMKLANYYKKEENQFCRLLTFNETELCGYDKIYFFSETSKKLIVPEAFKRANNVIYGGSAFTNGIYIPFENEVIEYTMPKPTIYAEFLKQKYSEGVKTAVISHVLDDTYYRMHAGENKLPIPPVKKGKRVYLFDRDFFYDDWEYIINDISDRKPCSIIRIHPIYCKTITDYFKLREYTKLNRTNKVVLDLNISLEDVSYMMKRYGKLFLADVNQATAVYIPLQGNQSTLIQYCRDLVYTLNLLYCFWSKNIPIRIYFIEPKIGTINPILELEQTIANWSCLLHNKKKLNRTILDRIGKYKILIEQYNKVIKQIPASKALFEQNYNELSQRGLWRV